MIQHLAHEVESHKIRENSTYDVVREHETRWVLALRAILKSWVVETDGPLLLEQYSSPPVANLQNPNPEIL